MKFKRLFLVWPRRHGKNEIIMDMRQPGENYCQDCPDHEACSTGYPCSVVKEVHREV